MNCVEECHTFMAIWSWPHFYCRASWTKSSGGNEKKEVLWNHIRCHTINSSCLLKISIDSSSCKCFMVAHKIRDHIKAADKCKWEWLEKSIKLFIKTIIRFPFGRFSANHTSIPILNLQSGSHTITREFIATANALFSLYKFSFLTLNDHSRCT